MREDSNKAGLETHKDAMKVIPIEKLFTDHYMQLLNFANRFLKDKEESEDIVQGVFYQLLRHKDTLDISKPLKSYLFTATRNSCIKRINHLKVRTEYKKDLVHFWDRSSNSTMEKILNNELENEVRKAINSLPTRCKLVFMLSRQSGLKYTEIADCLNISVKTVEKQMGKALKVLKKELKNYLPIYV